MWTHWYYDGSWERSPILLPNIIDKEDEQWRDNQYKLGLARLASYQSSMTAKPLFTIYKSFGSVCKGRMTYLVEVNEWEGGDCLIAVKDYPSLLKLLNEMQGLMVLEKHRTVNDAAEIIRVKQQVAKMEADSLARLQEAASKLKKSPRYSVTCHVRGWGNHRFYQVATGQKTVRVQPVNPRESLLDYLKRNPQITMDWGRANEIEISEEEAKETVIVEQFLPELLIAANLREMEGVAGAPATPDCFRFKIDTADQLNVVTN